jgi:hypothetical protein
MVVFLLRIAVTTSRVVRYHCLVDRNSADCVCIFPAQPRDWGDVGAVSLVGELCHGAELFNSVDELNFRGSSPSPGDVPLGAEVTSLPPPAARAPSLQGREEEEGDDEIA